MLAGQMNRKRSRMYAVGILNRRLMGSEMWCSLMVGAVVLCPVAGQDLAGEVEERQESKKTNSPLGPLPQVVEGRVEESLVTPHVIPFIPEEAEGPPAAGAEDSILIEELLESELSESLDPEPLLLEEDPIKNKGSQESPGMMNSVGVGLRDDGFLLRGSRALFPSTSKRRGTLSFSGYTESAYDSNPTLGAGSQRAVGSDFYFIVGGEVSYQRRFGDVNLELSYYGDYQQYLRKDALSNGYHDLQVSLAFEGELASLSLALGASNGSGANAYYQSQVEQFIWNAGLEGSYEISSLTSLRGAYEYSERNASARFAGGAIANDNTSQTLSLDALWHYSPLLKIGPGLRLAERSGAGVDRLWTLGPSVNVDYRLSTLVSLNATAAVNWGNYSEGGSSGAFLSSGVGLRWHPTDFWTFDLGVDRDIRASTTFAGGFVETFSGKLGAQRRVGRHTLRMGLSYHQIERAAGSRVATGDRDYFTIDLSVARTVFKDSELSLFANYRSLSAEGNDSEDSIVAGISLNHNF